MSISWEFFKAWLFIQLFKFSIVIILFAIIFGIVIYQENKKRKKGKIK